MSRTKSKNPDYYQIIKGDLVFLKNSLHSMVPGQIGNVIINCDDKRQYIGDNIGTITYDNYSDRLSEITDGCKYTFSLFDGSIICAYYCFDYDGNITFFSLSFLPHYESEQLFKKKSFNYQGEYYIRIDYEPNAFKENTHPKIHMHTTLFKDGLRIPVDKVVLASSFLYFILKNVYGNNGLDNLNKHITEVMESVDFECKLTQNELSSLFLKS